MPDITMCSGDGCPASQSCYRATATPSQFRQSYFLAPPIHTSGGNGCPHYYNNGKVEASNVQEKQE